MTSLPEIISDELELVDVETIQPHPRNPRRGDIDVIAESIKANGFYGALVAQRSTRNIVAGNHRYLAARQVGLTEVPVVWIDVDDAEAVRILLADNRTADLGDYDERQLVDLLRSLEDTAGTGYTDDDLSSLLANLEPAEPDAELDDVPDAPTTPRSKPGDIWHLGPHRVMVGDSGSTGDVDRLFGVEDMDFLITSPPYNVGVGYASHDDTTVPWEAYRQFLGNVLDAWIGRLKEGRALAWNIGTSPKTFHARQHILLETFGLTYLRTLVWRKVGVPVPLWHFTADRPVARQFTPNYTHEVVLLFAHGDELERGDRVEFDNALEHDVFSIHQTNATKDLPADETAPRTGSQGNLQTRARKAHPAPFPVELPRVFIQHLADVGAIVGDPFLGAGTSLLAAHILGRRCYGMEIEPRYVDVTCLRWERVTGIVPVLERDGEKTEVSFL